MARKIAKVIENLCVACGTCVGECPVSAIEVVKGMFARVDVNRCVGCMKCAKVCPASIIEMIEREQVI